MIPCSAICICLEPIRKGRTRCYRALPNRRDSIIPRSFTLTKTMPMHCSTFGWVSNVVVNRDFYHVSPVGFDKRSRKLPINQNNVFFYEELTN